MPVLSYVHTPLRHQSMSRLHPYAPVERSARDYRWVSRQGSVVIQATCDFTVKTVQKAADLAVQAGSRLYTDSASSYRALKGYVHEFVNHTQKEYARGEVHENRAECLFSLLKPYLRVFRGISKLHLPGYLGFFPFLRNFRHQNACEQAS
jgi:transposase-like protein